MSTNSVVFDDLNLGDRIIVFYRCNDGLIWQSRGEFCGFDKLPEPFFNVVDGVPQPSTKKWYLKMTGKVAAIATCRIRHVYLVAHATRLGDSRDG